MRIDDTLVLGWLSERDGVMTAGQTLVKFDSKRSIVAYCRSLRVRRANDFRTTTASNDSITATNVDETRVDARPG